MNIPRGKLIVFEGLDCSGKTTQLDMMFERLSSHRNVYKTANISNDIIGKTIRTILSNEDIKFANSEQIACLYLAELHHVCKLIKEELDKGIDVICSRHVLSTLAYAGTNDSIIDGIINLSNELVHPDLIIYVDVDLEKVKERLNNKDNTDYWETIDKQKEVAERYFNSMMLLKKKYNTNTVIVNGDRDIEPIHEEIYDFILKYFKW